MKKSIFLLVILALFSFISSCKKDTNDTIETEEVFLTEEQNSVFENTEEIDGFDSTNVILPNGETLENVIMELGAGYQKSLTKFDPRYTDLKMRTKTLTRALYLASLKKNTYPAAGPDKPEQVGIAYCYGGKDPFSRTKPIQSKCIDNIYGVDCAGFIYACFISSGIDLTRLVNGKKKHFGSNEIRKPETLRNKILEAYPEFGDYQVKDLGKISKEKILSGDIVYFKNTNGSVFHVGMFVRKKDGPIAFYNSNGTPDGCVANLTIKRGVRALNSGGYNDSAYWFKNYSWGITRLVGPLTIVKTKSVSQKKNGTTIFSGGEIIDPGASDIIAKGVCWSKSPFPTIFENKTDDGQGPNNYTSSIIGLDDNTPYYIRSYTTNSHGTSYGNMITYQSQNINYGTATDIDGNVYKTVVIGNQEWFAENLKTTKFNDGSVIPQISDDNSWSQLTSPAYCWYNNQPEFSNPYGALYNCLVLAHRQFYFQKSSGMEICSNILP